MLACRPVFDSMAAFDMRLFGAILKKSGNLVCVHLESGQRLRHSLSDVFDASFRGGTTVEALSHKQLLQCVCFLPVGSSVLCSNSFFKFLLQNANEIARLEFVRIHFAQDVCDRLALLLVGVRVHHREVQVIILRLA